MTELPKGWAAAPLDDLVSPESHALAIGPFGSNLKVTDYRDEGVLLVFVRNIRARDFDLVPTFVSETKAAELVAHRVEPGDVLITKMGDPPGDTTIYPGGRGSAILTADCIKATPHPEISGGYLSLAIESPACALQIGEMTSGVAQQKVSLGKIRQLQLPVAPVSEQERIVAAIEEAFSKLDAGEAGLRTVRQLLRRMRDAVLAAAVTGRLVPQDPTDTPASKLLADLGVEPGASEGPLALPDGWSLAAVSDVALVGSGTTPKRAREDYWLDGSIPWVTSGALNAGVVREASEYVTGAALRETPLRLWPAGTLLVAMYGEGQTRGRCAQLAIEATCNQACAAISVRNGLDDFRPILKLHFDANYSANRRLAAGGVQPNLSGALIKAMIVALPPPEEAVRIVAEVERQFSFLDACESVSDAELTRSAALRRSVLKSAFEGRLVPQDPSDAPASVLLERIRAERASTPRPARRARRTA